MAASMKTDFDVTISEIDVLSEIADAWQAHHFTAMLENMDYGDTFGMSPSELREMCLLSLQDLEPAEAAALVLDLFHLGTAMFFRRPGYAESALFVSGIARFDSLFLLLALDLTTLGFVSSLHLLTRSSVPALALDLFHLGSLSLARSAA